MFCPPHLFLILWWLCGVVRSCERGMDWYSEERGGFGKGGGRVPFGSVYVC